MPFHCPLKAESLAETKPILGESVFVCPVTVSQIGLLAVPKENKLPFTINPALFWKMMVTPGCITKLSPLFTVMSQLTVYVLPVIMVPDTLPQSGKESLMAFAGGTTLTKILLWSVLNF